ncbi:uncharacterized protein LOC135709417 [Ochlerotatus camptorhynchus]|uniref:uncharacterized protein LOC135709417 n=1 Tax=Ochlerotatus camptorhynchus TaxID=644619 RepID=UPI0031D35853
MSTPVAETKPAEEQVPKEEVKEETSTTTSEEVQMKEVKKEATAEPSTAAEPSTTAEPSTATEPSTTAEPTTAMEVDSSQTETKPEATSGEETKPEVKANGATSDAKAKIDNKLRLNGAARKRFRWLLDQGYTREEAAQLAKEPLKTKELRDRFNADTKKVGKAEQVDVKVDEELKNLSGAAKKRFKWLLKNGYTEKEALKLAREPMNAIASKRNLSTNDGPPSKISKPTPEVAGGIVMAVAAKDYPTTSLTNAQTNAVKSAILKEVVQQKDSELKPRFESCVHVKGYLRVHCSDQETRQWLQRVVTKLTVPEGINLKVASEKNLLKGDIYTGYFTDSRGDTNEAILEFVESQNDGINTSKWKILTRKEIQNKQTIELMFTVDQASAKSIHNLGYELNYKFNKIKIRKQIKASDKAPVVANSNVRMARNMAPPQRERRTFNQPRPISSGSFVPIWDSNLPQKRAGNNFNQFDNPRNSGSGNGWSNGGNSFGLGGGGSGSFGMNNGGNSFGGSNSGGNGGRSNSGGNGGRSNSFMGSNSRSNSFGGSNNRSNSFGGSNNRSNSNSNSFGMGGGRGGNQSNSNRPFDLVDSLYDQLKLIGGTGGNNDNNNGNGYGSTRRSGGNNNGGGSNQWGRNTSSNSSFSGRSNSGLGNRNFFTTTRSGFF